MGPVQRHQNRDFRNPASNWFQSMSMGAGAFALISGLLATGIANLTPAFAVTPMLNCALKPSTCGYPDASNTGVPAGVTLKSVPSQVRSGPGWHWDTRGWVTIDGDGAVFSGYKVNAPIDVTADNVAISNVLSTLGGENFGIALRHANNTTISWSQIGPPIGSTRLMVGIKDIYGDSLGTRIYRNEITNTSTGIQIEQGGISNNFIHEMGFVTGDHTNGITSNGSRIGLVIRHNTIFNQRSQTDAIGLFEDFGVQANRLIDNNLLAGGSYTIYAGQNPGGPTAYNIRVTNNRISRLFFARGGQYGPGAAYNRTATGNQWSNNVWDSTNALIGAP
jgi:hypothetical protein